ncbi:SH3 domain-containing protein [Sphingomonas sp. M1-B02]|uniref:SH3 domain-containing protein n=1 Tax=Sphingomonas sp. M1-B02 TaxID=3114300 RepID=UPI00223F71A1|nr:SH3 domain-containing protein [Sphingomonas sp. S6-11]UZK67087.1 SH3 domain-containing protein [Sphingomonas sp. S6-11]
MRFWSWLLLGVFALGLALPALAQRKPPYYASISADKARMRTGPGRNYPASWLYQRADLPIKVVDIYGEWRKVEDPDGTQGWMQVNLLSDTRSAIVRGAIAEMRAAPRFDAPINFRAAPGVVGRISKCASGWCWLDVRGRGGYVELSHIWGVDAGEAVD